MHIIAANIVLLLGAVRLISVSADLPITRSQQQATANKREQETHNYSFFGSTPTFIVPSPVSNQSGQATANHTEHELDNRKEWFWPPIWSNWALVLIGAGGTLVALRTLRNIERQTKANELSAAAAKASADILQLGQRAWISSVISANFDPPSLQVCSAFTISLHFKNTGNTPAINLRTSANLIWPSKGTATDFRELGQEENRGVIAPGQEFDVVFESGPILQGFVDSVNSGNRTLYIYGIVRYEDIFRKQHWAKFCYYYLPAAKPGLIVHTEHNDIDRD